MIHSLTRGRPSPSARLCRSAAAVLLCAGAIACDGAEPSKGTDATQLRLTIAPSAPTERVIPRALMGFNCNYAFDTDEIWETGKIPERLQTLGVGALRYPGGAITTAFHWRHPGVNAGVDIWHPKAAERRGWQTTYVKPEDWATNKNFMDYDEFMAHCKAIGAEPIVGINIRSGLHHNRLDDSLNEAVEWVRHARESGYKARYWYLDNEPWKEQHKAFGGLQRWAQMARRFALAMKAEDSTIRVFAEVTDGGGINRYGAYDTFLGITDGAVDGLNIHIYWEWGQATWARWLSHKPVKMSSPWRPYDKAKTFTRSIADLRTFLDNKGYDDVELAALEWNITAPRKNPVPPRQSALILSEIWMQFAVSPLDQACMWPMFYQTQPPSASAHKRIPEDYRSIFSQTAPYKPSAIYRSFSLFTPALGATLLPVEDGSGEYPSMAALTADGKILLYMLSKADVPTSLAVSCPGYEIDQADSYQSSGQMVSITTSQADSIVLPPLALTRIRLSPPGR